MSIRDAVFQQAKFLESSTYRQEIAEIIRSLGVEYFLQSDRCQLLPYVFHENFFAGLPTGMGKLNITEEKQTKINGAYKAFESLNKACLAPVLEEKPELWKVLDPNLRYTRKLPVDNRLEVIEEIELFSDPFVTRTIESFHQHPAVNFIKFRLDELISKIDINDYQSYILRLKQNLQGNLFEPSEEIQNMLIRDKDINLRAIERHFFSVVCLSHSLRVMNQILFQKILSDRLKVFDRDNICYISGDGGHLTAEPMFVQYQLESKPYFAKFQEIILIDFKSPKRTIKKFCEVGAFMITLEDQYLGGYGQLELRAVDENLNPYWPILNNPFWEF